MKRFISFVFGWMFFALAFFGLVKLFAFYADAAAPVITPSGELIIQKNEAPESTSAYILTDSEYDLLCRIICLEAGGEGEELQRAVTECVYNRIKCGYWGDNVESVVYSMDQFEVVPNLDNAIPSQLTKRIVKEVFETGSTIPARVMFFRTDYYHAWSGSVPEFSIGNVYFSSSRWMNVTG